MADRLQESIHHARQALKTASVIRETDDARAALNRLYYACFHAARAVLFDQRQDADYGFGPVTGDVERLSRQAAAFVDRMDNVLAEPLDDASEE